MPDDIITDQGDLAQAAVAEQGPDFDAEFEAGLDDEPQGQAEGQDKAADDKAAAQDGEGSDDAEGQDKGQDQEAKDGDGALASILAKAEAAEKAATQGGEQPGGGKPPAGPADKGQEQGQDGGKPAKMTKEETALYLDFFKDILPDEPILVGDKEINVKALEEDLPGIGDAIRIGSGRAANKLVRHMAERGDIVTGSAMRQVVEQTIIPLTQQVEDMRFWLDVAMQDGTALQTINSQEMKDWIATQPAPVQKMAKAISTRRDALEFVQAFRESKAKVAAGEHDKKSRKALDRTRALHSDGAGGRRQPAKGGDGKGTFEDGFDSV